MMNYPDLTKEQAYYKMLFDEYYPNKFSVIHIIGCLMVGYKRSM